MKLIFMFALMLLTGCASGVRMSDDERASCRTEGCAPWTQDGLRQLMNRAASEGYKAGATPCGSPGGMRDAA